VRIAGHPRRLVGWTGGLVERAESALGKLATGDLAGVVEEAENFFATEAGRLDVRGGTRIKVSLDDGAGNFMTSVPGGIAYTPIGVLLIGHKTTGGGKHYTFLYPSDLAALTTRTDIGGVASSYNSTTPIIPSLAELWEKGWLCDSTIAYASRKTLVSVNSTGTIVQPTFQFAAGPAAALKPYCLAVHNGVLLIAGYGDEAAGDAPATLRHSFLGRDPGAANGFDKDAWNIIGAKGQRITALAGGTHSTLVAKEHELYLLTGAGRAVEGWQYQVRPITQTTQTEYAGVANPLAVCFSDGYWYGVGASGPFRTDGVTVEMMVGARRQSWEHIVSLDRAYVAIHPDRRHVLFGLVEAGSTFPNVIWTWDIQREQWGADQRFLFPTTAMRAVRITAVQAPTAIPTALAFTHTSATTTSIAGTFTPGDATAQTEVWIDLGAGFVLSETLAPAVATFTVSVVGGAALEPAHSYPVKLRHIKSGITSDFTAQVLGYTRLEQPAFNVLSGTTGFANVRGELIQLFPNQRLRVTRGVGGPVVMDKNPAPTGNNFFNDNGATCFVNYTYEAWNSRSDWPAAINESVRTQQSVNACTN
jgi:hypothetical protein